LTAYCVSGDIVTVLSGICPHHHKTTIRKDCRGWTSLTPKRRRIDQKLAADPDRGVHPALLLLGVRYPPAAPCITAAGLARDARLNWMRKQCWPLVSFAPRGKV
jgi:hypothetical protein